MKVHKVVGYMNWEELKNFIILQFALVNSEKELVQLVGNLIRSCGSLKKINAKRKQLGLEPLKKGEI